MEKDNETAERMSKLTYDLAIARLIYMHCDETIRAPIFRLDYIGAIQDTIDEFNLPHTGAIILVIIANMQPYVIKHYNARLDIRKNELNMHTYPVVILELVKTQFDKVNNQAMCELAAI